MGTSVVHTRRLFVLLLAGISLSTHPLAAQQTGAIAGSVRDAATGGPLSSVQVEVRGGANQPVGGALTTGEGTFRLGDIPAGTYDVSFSIPGWLSYTEKLVSVSAGRTSSLSIALTERSYNLNPITITASRNEEKVLDAPAAVEVVSARDIGEHAAVSIGDHVKDLAGVDMITTGLQQNYIVARGFNNIFSGAMLMMVDNRIARVPSLRANILHLNPTTDADIERIEVVLGPGSALYGPNAANGVVHVITKSPIDFPGQTFSAAGGERESFHGEGRVAVRASEKFGVKLSGQYFQGRDFRFEDPSETTAKGAAGACLAAFAPTNPACAAFGPDLNLTDPTGVQALSERVNNVAGGRNFTLRRYAFDGRMDIRPTPNSSIIFSGGRTDAVNSVDLTGIGASQVQDFKFSYAQARVNVGDFFGQLFYNVNDSGNTFLLRTGQPTIDTSNLIVGQLQHSLRPTSWEHLIYGFDVLRTNPRTAGSINGINEDDDIITEVGGYIQTETALSDKLDFVAALRVDNHSELNNAFFSPRGAFVFKPNASNSVRLTFNRSFSTPTANNLFLDIRAGAIPLGGPFGYDIRAQGSSNFVNGSLSDTGFSFRRSGDGTPMHQSPFNLLFGGAPTDFLPTTTPQLWAEAVAVVSASNPAAGALLASLPAPTAAQVPINVLRLNTSTGSFEPFAGGLAGVQDFGGVDREVTNTLEGGYKGVLANRRVWLAVNAWYTRKTSFIGPLRIESPNVFLDGAGIAAYLQGFGLDAATAGALAQSIAPIPLGVIAPQETRGSRASLLLAYKNFGSVNLGGADVSATILATDELDFKLGLSLVSDDTFQTEGQTIALNAPTVKFSTAINYRNQELGLNAGARVRYSDSFPANSGVFVGPVSSYGVLDLNFGYKIPGLRGAIFQIDVQNVTDNNYQTFPGAPQLGRFSMFRIKYDY